MKQLDFNKLLNSEWVDQFDSGQMATIRWGLNQGVDVSHYAKPEFDYGQMIQIHEGLVSGVDVSVYAKPDFDHQQMFEIRRGLEEGLDLDVYINPAFTHFQMRQIRNGLINGLDVTSYAKPEISGELMREAHYGQIAERHEILTAVVFGKNAAKFQWLPESESDVKRKYAGWLLAQVVPVREKGEWLVPKELVVDIMVAKEKDSVGTKMGPGVKSAVDALVEARDVEASLVDFDRGERQK